MSSEQWEEERGQLLLPEIERQQAQGKEVTFRGDAAFAKPELYAALEKRDVKYVIRLPANNNLQGNITARRVVAKIEFHCGELFPASALS